MFDLLGDQNHVSNAKNQIEPSKYDFSMITTPNQREHFCLIRYVYDYLSSSPRWLHPQPISLTGLSANSEWRNKPLNIGNEGASENSISLNLQSTSLPIHTGLVAFRQSKHWRSNEQACRELLELFAYDERCSRVMLSDRRSMADLAAEQLKNEAVIDTYSRFSIYMFPEADERRSQLLAQSIVLIFLFDGKRLCLQVLARLSQ